MASVPPPPCFKYWDDCVDPEDMQAMWMDADVSKEWMDAGEMIGQKVHLSRDPDGHTYLTQTEMMAVSAAIVHRHFMSQVDPDILCAIAEIETDRQPLALNYDRKTKEARLGIMQLKPSTAEWLYRELGYKNYDVEGHAALLYRPFVNLYFGAAYVKWLYSYDGKERSEEFVVRAFKGGVKKATSKSTVDYFQRYLSVRQTLPRRRKDQISENPSGPSNAQNSNSSFTECWDSRVSSDDMEDLWRHPDVQREWTKSAERRGRVRFSLDKEKKPYLSRVEVKAIAEIIISRHFSTRGVKAAALAALAEICSLRFVYGMGTRTGLMGIDFPVAVWLYNEHDRKAYTVNSVDDLYNPLASMYFGAAYLAWLSEYEGRERTYEFVVQAYLGGPENVNVQETSRHWRKFQQILGYYDDSKRDAGSCRIL